MFRTAALILLFALALASCDKPLYAAQLKLSHPDKTGSVIEYFADRPSGTGPWPTIIFLHGHQSLLTRVGGKAFVKWGVLKRFANEGYLAVAVSLPGYGSSSGPEDFAGPFTQHAVAAVITKLKSERQAVPDRILIEGISLGAVTAGLVAAHDPDIAGLVLISGLYDLPAFFAQPKSAAAAAIKASTLQQVGGDDALRSRSLLSKSSSIHAATLILNGAKDDRTDPDQARQLAVAINANGGQAEVVIYPEFGHEIPVRLRDAKITPFIKSTLKR
jgi:dipeptidyl aminopeptidase/acylaminoacyl peptidase